ncbi:hypothetical protein [Sphingomonas yabuuchiae]|uniref:hypothetical protein n=1 Tax=Sphingomonas yabuuchiae TaxID=172044 RepID=UPI003D98E5B2
MALFLLDDRSQECVEARRRNWIVLVSVAAPCLAIWVALHHIRRRRGLLGCLAAGGVTTFGVGAMHLIGMSALIVPAQIRTYRRSSHGR